MSRKPTLVFMGTPEFAATTLTAFIDSERYTISAVVCQPDKPRGRGKKLQSCPVKQVAMSAGIDVLQPTILKQESDFYHSLKSLRPDCITVIAYGRILPNWVLDLPPYGCLNGHASILPKYRGASPITAALVNGDAESGVALMKIVQELDAGPVIAVKRVPIDEVDTFSSLHDKLVQCCINVFDQYLPLWLNHQVSATEQPHTDATFTRPLPKKIGRIDWTQTTVQIFNKIRAYDPWPSAFSLSDTKQIKFFEASKQCDSCDVLPNNLDAYKPGTLVAIGKKKLYIRTGDGFIAVASLQLEGRKRLSISAFLNGASFDDKHQFG